MNDGLERDVATVSWPTAKYHAARLFFPQIEAPPRGRPGARGEIVIIRKSLVSIMMVLQVVLSSPSRAWTVG